MSENHNAANGKHWHIALLIKPEPCPAREETGALNLFGHFGDAVRVWANVSVCREEFVDRVFAFGRL